MSEKRIKKSVYFTEEENEDFEKLKLRFEKTNKIRISDSNFIVSQFFKSFIKK